MILRQGSRPAMNIPNILTLARIVFIPLLVVLFYLPFSWSMPVAAGLFALASVTDWLPGPPLESVDTLRRLFRPCGRQTYGRRGACTVN